MPTLIAANQPICGEFQTEGRHARQVGITVTQPLGLCLGEVAVEEEGLGPDDQVVRDQDEFEPDLVELVFVEGELAHP
ncbi:MAG: hypothetical protein M3071_06205, partial [Actinomycetota bacterium]|nr:hypothetical protein [Actinomycetota bacterium]